jgi:peptidoglycan/xylan/chitin deacetylase (PgdA/CDA1 family)
VANAKSVQDILVIGKEKSSGSPAKVSSANANYVLADENMSNLQLTDAEKPVFDAYTLAERQTNNLPTAMPEVSPFVQGKIAYLTFDDGPDEVNTPVILDILANYGIKGTFYVTGRMCEKNPEVLKRIFEEGHAIGNHSYNHNYSELYADRESFLEQVTETDEVIHKILGVRPLIVRAPGGAATMFDSSYMPMLTACGYAEHDWNVSTEDATAEHPDAARQLEHVNEQISCGVKDDAAIVLMHSTSGKEETAAALPSIIASLVEQGYSFGVVTPMTPQPW